MQPRGRSTLACGAYLTEAALQRLQQLGFDLSYSAGIAMRESQEDTPEACSGALKWLSTTRKRTVARTPLTRRSGDRGLPEADAPHPTTFRLARRQRSCALCAAHSWPPWARAAGAFRRWRSVPTLSSGAW